MGCIPIEVIARDTISDRAIADPASNGLVSPTLELGISSLVFFDQWRIASDTFAYEILGV